MFFILNKLVDIAGDHSYVTDLVVRGLYISKENFEAICDSFCNITSLSFIDCEIEIHGKIATLPLKELSFTNVSVDDNDLNIINDLNDLEILIFIDMNELDLRYIEIISRVKNLTIAYDQLVNSDECIEFIKAEYLDIRGTRINLEGLKANENLKTLITNYVDASVIPSLKEKGVTIKVEAE